MLIINIHLFISMLKVTSKLTVILHPKIKKSLVCKLYLETAKANGFHGSRIYNSFNSK